MNDDSPQTKPLDIAGLLVGLAVVATCLFVVWHAWGYGVGTPRHMGAGFFPFVLGVTGTVLGLAMVVRCVRPAGAMRLPGEKVPLRRLIFIGSAFVFFALAIENLGLIAALFGTTIIGAYADADARVVQTVALAGGLTAAIWFIFVYLLGLSIPLWPGAF